MYTRFFFPLLLIACVFSSCLVRNDFKADFNNINDRIWNGHEFWAVPLEDWQVQSGRLECTGTRPGMRVNLLTPYIDGAQDKFTISMNLGLIETGKNGGAAGFTIGLNDPEDSSVKAACYFGDGWDAGIDTEGALFLGDQKVAMASTFSMANILLKLEGKNTKNKFILNLHATDGNESAMIKATLPEGDSITGIIALFNKYRGRSTHKEGARFWFDNLKAGGPGISIREENTFGPVLWSMYTLSRSILKISAQMPPLGLADNHELELQFMKNGDWQTLAKETMDPQARNVVFRIESWEQTKDVPYRLSYHEKLRKGEIQKYHFDGTIRKEPAGTPLKLGALTCQNHYGYPYTPVVQHLTALNPDMLYFSGDQIYEGNGGYRIIRNPAEMATLNYLGKWYMFGWAFGNLMRDRPTVVVPDDHDVFQGNLWGAGGRKILPEDWRNFHGTSGGYVEPPAMVNAVHRTQCGHLPDPYDPTPIGQEIKPYYTDLVYGKVSFAIISDRMFKSGPNDIATWKTGRKDWIQTDIQNPSILDSPHLNLLGERQKQFLEAWAGNWKGAKMKCLLSQTVFGNVATHHGGGKIFLYGDMDSGGWPKTERDWVVRLLRQCFAFHISGDQHLPSFVQYGLDDDYGSGSWAFCTPAIATGYERRFLPDRLGWPVLNRPDHGLPNTGDYMDVFGNRNTVYAIGNPEDNTRASERYTIAQNRSSGFGIVTFNTISREIRSEAYRFKYDPADQSSSEQFPGWPITIGQLDNYGKPPTGYLPQITVNGIIDPVFHLIDTIDNSTIYILRIRGNTFRPKVYSDHPHQIKIGDPELDRWRLVTAEELQTKEKIVIDF